MGTHNLGDTHICTLLSQTLYLAKAHTEKHKSLKLLHAYRVKLVFNL